MRLKIQHETEYSFAGPVPYALQRLRLEPKSSMGQNVLSWEMDIDGAVRELEYEDSHHNRVALLCVEHGCDHVRISCSGEVETSDTVGVVGPHRPHMPLWAYHRPTSLTEAGKGVSALVSKLGNDFEDDLSRLHALSSLILGQIEYETGRTDSTTSAEAAIEAEHGVCQDHAHVFIAAARHMEFPARYVSGYLMMDDRVEQDASHAWAEVHMDGIGWVGFDISNGISPDSRYVRVATGFDYRDAAPITGMTFGARDETMLVSLMVEQ